MAPDEPVNTQAPDEQAPEGHEESRQRAPDGRRRRRLAIGTMAEPTQVAIIQKLFIISARRKGIMPPRVPLERE